MKRIKALLAALFLLASLTLSLFSCGGTKPTNTVVITVSGYGSIIVELYPEIAPITVKNFQKLVSKKFYDGSSFHRVIEGFMIQGGASASGKKADTIVGEFAANGYRNDLLHTRGVISMARTVYADSASSQFFIMQGDRPNLDGYYAAFGRVIEGMEVVDAIASVDTDSSDRPEDDIVIKSIRFLSD